MKTLVVYSCCSFPVSAVAGSILTGKLPEHYPAGGIREILSASASRDYSEGQIYYLGQTPEGARVAAFTARSGKTILGNMINSFLEIHQIDQDRCAVVEVNTPPGLSLLLGELLLKIPLNGRIGMRMMEKYIEKIYPELVRAVKLDCTCQISDN